MGYIFCLLIGLAIGYFGHAVLTKFRERVKNEMDDYLTRDDQPTKKD